MIARGQLIGSIAVMILGFGGAFAAAAQTAAVPPFTCVYDTGSVSDTPLAEAGRGLPGVWRAPHSRRLGGPHPGVRLPLGGQSRRTT